VQDALGKGAERFIPYLKDIVEFGGQNAKVTAEQAEKAKEFETT
jgi:activator of 2-hydroxyglutaryl-CoA dehydratase